MSLNAIETELGPLCACGCGGHLPVGSDRQYKRGHRKAANEKLADQIEQGNGVFDGYEFRYNAEPIDPYSFIPESMDEAGWETVADAAGNVPDDPEGSLWANEEKGFSFGEFKLPARSVQKDIEGKIAFMLTMTGTAISMPDPVCGNAILQNAPQITKALTPIICQSPGIVQWFQKTSNIMLYVNLLMAMAPLVSTVFGHHVGRQKAEVITNGQVNIPVDPSHYGVQ